jgi:hypothetical protein
MKFNRIILIFPILLIALLLSACSKTSAGDPAGSVEAYWQSLVAKDSARMSALSCSAFEAEALTTLDSFKSVETTMADLACTTSDQAGDSATVKCTGTITASYGTENLVIDLAQKTYSVTKEGGDWRFCGEK